MSAQSDTQNRCVAEYKKKYEGYTFRIDWTESKPWNPDDESLDIILTVKSGEEYTALFVTLPFLQRMFEKNKTTGECASGAYFCMPGMIVARQLDEPTIRATIDDMICRLDVDEYFRKRD